MDRRTVPVAAAVRRPLLRQMLRPVAAFAAVVAAGAVGFSALGGVGVVSALFWLLDPTSIELHFRDHQGPERLVKGYAIVVLSGVVVAGLWIGETLLSAAFGGRIQRELKEMQIERTVDGLDGHVVVCGYGTFGKTIAARLDETDRDVVVVKRKGAQYRRAIDDEMLAVNTGTPGARRRSRPPTSRGRRPSSERSTTPTPTSRSRWRRASSRRR